MSQRLQLPFALKAGAAAFALALSVPAFGQSLLQVYRDAVANDPNFAAARASYQASQEAVPQARAGLLPSAGLQANATHTSTDYTYAPPTPSSSFDNTSRGFSLSLSQPLFRWQNWEGYKQSQLSVLAAEAQFVQAQQDLILRVSQAYFDVLAAQDSLEFTRAQKKAIEEQLASAKRNFEVGTATITDTNEAQARYDLAVANEIAAVNDLEVKRAALQQITGKAPGSLAPMRSGVQLPAPQPSAIDQWVTNAERDNVGVRVAQANAEIATREISKARAGHYPTVDLVASYGRTYNPSTANLDRLTTTQAGVQLSLPLFSGFATQSRVAQTVALEDQAKQNLEAARRTAAQGARSAYLGVTNGLAQVKALEAAEVSSKTALEANQLGYKVGVRVNIDVLNAQQQLYQTRRDLSKARYDTLVGGLKLKSAAGRLEEADVQQVDALLNK